MSIVNHIVFVADRSGSMHGICPGACRGYNEFKSAQSRQGGLVYVSTLLFDTGFEYLHRLVPAKNVPDITPKIWAPNSSTALRDAVGMAVQNAEADISNLQTWHPGYSVRTTFAIITDGGENASRRWPRAALVELIQRARIQGCVFLFQGANQDSAATASALGIDPDYAGNFAATNEGISESFRTMSRVQLSMRAIP